MEPQNIPIEIYKPCDENRPNQVVERLKSQGLYLSETKDAVRFVCPFKKKNEAEASHAGTYYFPSDQNPLGKFICPVCKKSLTQFLKKIDCRANDIQNKSEILLVASGEDRIAAAIGHALCSGGRVFRCEDVAVLLQYDEKHNPIGYVPLFYPDFRMEVCRRINFVRHDTQGKHQLTQPSKELLSSVLQSSIFLKSLKPIKGAIYHPYVDHQGKYHLKSGYDPETQLIGLFEENKFKPYIKINPSEEDARISLADLLELLIEFAFESELDQVSSLISMFTAIDRPILDSAPMIGTTAPSFGSGKSLLCKLFALLASFLEPTFTSMPDNQTEMLKTLTAILKKGVVCVCFDNLTGDLPVYDALCSAITESKILVRIITTPDAKEYSTRILLLASGIKITPTKDMARRTLMIRLCPAEDLPAERKFKTKNLLAKVRKNRERYIVDILTIQKAWLDAGEPKSELTRIASFEGWADLCVQPLR